MRRVYGWLILGIFIGCQSQSASEPVVQTPSADSPVIAEALKLMEQGQIEAGLERLRAEIALHPQDGRLYGAQATLHHRAGLIHEALQDLDQALETLPDDAQLLNNRGFIRLALERYPEAITDLDRALEINPDLLSAYNNRGLVSLAQGKHRDAIVWFSQALSRDNNFADALNNRGFAWMQLGRWETAYADLNQALRVNPKYVNALHNRGLLKARIGENQDALLDFTQAMMQDPLNPKYYEHRSGVYTALDMHEEARADLKMLDWLVELQSLNRAVALQPRNPTAWMARANHYFNQGDLTKTQSDLKQVLELSPQNASAMILQARIALSEKRTEEAVRLADDALKIEESQAAWSLRGDACLALKRYDDALESFAAAKRFDAAVAETHFRKSQSLAAQGQTDAAQQQLELAKDLDPEVELRLR